MTAADMSSSSSSADTPAASPIEPVPADQVARGDGAAPQPAIITVTKWKIACDGDVKNGLGHPRVWLRIPPEIGFVECGYCDRRYVIDRDRAEGEH